MDVAAAATLATFMAAMSVAARVTQPEAHPVTTLGLALLLVCGLALAVRRPLPLLAFTLTVGAAVAYLGLRFAGWPVYLGAFAGLVALVSEVAQMRLWVPPATVGGVAVAVATGPPEGWDPARMITIARVWAVVAVLAARGAQIRRRLAEEEATSRMVAERLRIARELHDVLSHSLASISLQAGVGLHLVDRQPEQARQALDTIRQVSTDALAQARVALALVRGAGGDPPAATPGLADLDGLVASVGATGLRVDLDTELDGERVPDVIVMDIRMPVLDGLEATRAIAADPRLSDVRVLVLTTYDEDTLVFEAIRAGAAGFLLKDAEPTELLRGIRIVAAGDTLLAPQAARRLVAAFASTPAPKGPAPRALELLTDREREVVALVGRGLSNDEIAERLVISPATARTHVSRAMVKLAARDRAQLVVFAYESGLVHPGRS